MVHMLYAPWCSGCSEEKYVIDLVLSHDFTGIGTELCRKASYQFRLSEVLSQMFMYEYVGVTFFKRLVPCFVMFSRKRYSLPGAH